MPAEAEKGRLVIVSNRLPVSVKNMGQGRYETKPSSGGLVTGIRGLVNSGVEFIWFGWPGEEIAKDSISELKGSLLKDHNAVPVLLDKRVSDLHYNGFSSMHTIGCTMIIPLTGKQQIPQFGHCFITNWTKSVSTNVT